MEEEQYRTVERACLTVEDVDTVSLDSVSGGGRHGESSERVRSEMEKGEGEREKSCRQRTFAARFLAPEVRYNDVSALLSSLPSTEHCH